MTYYMTCHYSRKTQKNGKLPLAHQWSPFRYTNALEVGCLRVVLMFFEPAVSSEHET